jgi:hypothetical protein
MHGLVALFLGVIAVAIVLLVIGLVAPCILIVVLTMIVALILLMMMVRSAIVVIASVALTVIAVLVTSMMMVAPFMAMRSRKMSHLPFLWLHLVLGNLPENASRLVGCLTLLKKAIILSGLVGTVLFKLANLFWCALGYAKKICSLFSCIVGLSIVQRR